MHVAAEKFEATVYDPAKGVQAYKAELQRWGSRMTQAPNAYTLRKKFLDGLPSSMIIKMIEEGASPDLAKISKMVKTVERIENHKALANYYVSSSKKIEKTPSPYLKKRYKTERREGRYQPFRREENTNVRNDGRYSSGTKPDNQYPKSSDKGKERATAPAAKPASKETGYAKKPNTGSIKNTHGKLCFSCGKPGHFANDPTCKRYGKSRLYAIREDEVLDPPSDDQGLDAEGHEENVPPLQEDSDDESSLGDWDDLEKFEEPYMGRLADDDDFFGSIREVHLLTEENPLEGAGPPILLEEDFDEKDFPSLDADNHPYQDDINRCGAMDPKIASGAEASEGKYRVRKLSKPMDRPNRGDPKDRQPMTVLMNIGGHQAFVLLDSGCTIEALSPAHVQLTGGKIRQLNDQHSLQLGTVGSRAKFNYGTTMKTAYADICEDVYYDIINIDRYDAIVGTRFMRKHGIQLDFQKGQVLIRGKPAPTLSMGEDSAEFTRRSSMKREAQAEKFRRKETQASQK